MTKKSSGDYEVGYRKPPAAHQFKPGQRANPQGRPKVRPSPSQVLESQLHAMVPITEGGKKKYISKLEVLIRNTLTGAMLGKPGATKMLALLLQRFPLPVTDTPGSDDTRFTPEEEAEIKALFGCVTQQLLRSEEP